MNLNKRITIVKSFEIDDGAGGLIDDFKSIRSIFANVKVLKAQEQYVAQQLSQKTTHSIIIRFTQNISKLNYIKYKGELLKIETIIPFDKESNYLQISCTNRWN